MGLRSRERRDQHLLLGEDAQTWVLRAPSPWSLRARWPCGTLQFSANHVLGPRQAQARFSSSMRSEFQVAQFADMLMVRIILQPRHGPQRPDCVADDAVSCELVSAPNSLLTGKLTGNFTDSGSLQRFWRSVSERIQ